MKMLATLGPCFKGCVPSEGRSMPNTFVAPKVQEFTIQNDEGEILGHIKIRPSSILWREPEVAQWHRVRLTQFIKLARDEGELVDN
jgi:hypothetical protein